MIRKLKAREREIRALGVRSLYLFGSVLRDEATAKSDVDLFFDYDDASDFSLIELAAARRYIGRVLDTDVDLITRNSLHPLIRKDVEAAAQRVL